MGDKPQQKPTLKAYVRISTSMQDIEKQKQRIQEACGPYAGRIIYYEDVVSGSIIDRPGLSSLIESIEMHDSVVVSDLSRLARNVEEGLRIRKYFLRYKVVFSTLDNEDYLLSEEKLPIYISLLQSYENELAVISSRVSTAMRVITNAGKLRNRPPFGYKFVGKNKDFEPVPEQQVVLEKIHRLHAMGVCNNRITKILNDDGDNLTLALNSKDPDDDKVRVFHAQTVSRILAMTPEDYERRIRCHRTTVHKRLSECDE